MKEIEFTIPDGYKQSARSTENKLVFELQDLKKDKEKFILNIFQQMSPKNTGILYETNFFVGNKYMFQQDWKNERLWVSYNNIWLVLSTKYNMKYDEIQAFIKTMVETHLKWRGLTIKAMLNTLDF